MPLKSLIRRLLQLEEPFANAAEARQVLLKIPADAVIQAPNVSDANDAQKSKRLSPMLIGGALLVLGMGGLLFAQAKQQKQPAQNSSNALILANIKDVSAIPLGEFRYQ